MIRMNYLRILICGALFTIATSSDMFICPKNDVIGICVFSPNSCLSDSDCHEPGKRCCSYGCGKECLYPVLANVCTTGLPATKNGVQLFCGRGPNSVACPANHVCNIAPNDAYAVCCPEVTNPCSSGEPATGSNGAQLFCGQGANSVACPTNHVCNVAPDDTYAVCCPEANNICQNGPAAKGPDGVELFCGRGDDRVDCPTGYHCNIAPNDAYAVCCPHDTCEAKTCGSRELCFLNQVQCITSPCPPIPECYSHPCQDVRCGPNEECRLKGGCDGTCKSTAQCEPSTASNSSVYYIEVVIVFMSVVISKIVTI